MNGTGDSMFEYDSKSRDESFDNVYAREDLEIKPLTSHQQRYKKNLLTNAAKYFTFLEQQCLIDCLETDEEVIVSAGRDHDINIWAEGICEGQHIHRLSGHHAPVTGLSMFNSGHSKFDKIIVSSSEDGSIRIWSLNKGEELHRIETGSVITCLGIMNKSLAVTGNHKGYMEVYHLRSGNLYTSIRAHADPIDALEVDGNYACTATFEEPSCLKVWDIQFEQTRCIYRLEYSPEIEFCCLAMWNTKALLGSSNEQKLFVVDFKSDRVDSINLDRPGGRIERVKVWNEWIISCSRHKAELLLDVLRFHKYEHFGTFLCRVKQVKAIAAIELNTSLKIVLGGSALALLNFDFILTDEETDIPDSRFPIRVEKTTFAENKEKDNYTMKHELLDDFRDENSIDFDEDDSESDILPNSDEKVTNALQSNFDYKHFNQGNNSGQFIPLLKKIEADFSNYNESRASTPQSNSDESHHIRIQDGNVKIESPTPPRQTQMLSVLTLVKREAHTSPGIRTSPTQDITEPRVAIRKLKEELDKNKEEEECENFAKNNKIEEENDDIVIVKDITFKCTNEDSSIELIELDSDENNVEETEIIVYSELKSDIKEVENLSNNKDLSIKEDIKKEIKDENIKNLTSINKNSKKKNKKCKKDKKKESQKSKHRKCQIM